MRFHPQSSIEKSPLIEKSVLEYLVFIQNREPNIKDYLNLKHQVPPEPDRGPAARAGGQHGGAEHPQPHHQALRQLPVLHQRHPVGTSPGKIYAFNLSYYLILWRNEALFLHKIYDDSE